ncbi:hypothetical protein GGD63_007131 [Bradyrhizobium sp. cir1]|uniref:DUF2806 domain-containing protein n=1 Tax=Bradyrhizobium sp. cir1 TaxID=1445730 RepID=UPI0016060F1D|nr:DUF2806 domain-containing protein [Bradyrhizobium sp. cir1]MBB4374301.1 hypothetical protein [Bradyrhizobium sp. cir1]
MSDDSKGEDRPSALVQVKDLLGLSGAAKIIAEGVVHGVGAWLKPTLTKRQAKADVEAMKLWSNALKEDGLSISAAELSLGDRASIRALADEQRHQLNREAIALCAVEEFRASAEELRLSKGHPFDPDWLDRFWSFAENVSNDDFRSIWARILVRQGAGKSSYSFRTLYTLSMLARDEAEALSRLAPFATTSLLSGGETTAMWLTAADHLDRFVQQNMTESTGTTLSQINRQVQTLVKPVRQEVFGPAGIMVDSGWAYEARATVTAGTAHIKIAGVPYSISGFPSPLPILSDDGECALLGSGISFSSVGAEIIELIAAQPDSRYVELLTSAFRLHGLNLARSH